MERNPAKACPGLDPESEPIHRDMTGARAGDQISHGAIWESHGGFLNNALMVSAYFFSNSGGSMRIVLVDTSRTVLKCVGRMLEAGGHAVIPFTDGHEALYYIKTHPDIAAVVTSAELVSMTGIEMCWETRLIANNRRPIYIVLMSSNYDRAHLAEALDMGADDFIGKPPIAEELYARLRAAERFAFMQNELIRLATTDPLTGVRNRRAFFERTKEACAHAANGGALSAVMLDIDHFKKINDVYGHDAGDEALRAVTRVIAEDEAITGRLGGEEFAILFENTALAEAAALAEQLRQELALLRIDICGKVITLTCSFGVSQWQKGDTIDTFLKRADAALYEAKHGGRNRVVSAKTILSDLRPQASSGVIRSARH